MNSRKNVYSKAYFGNYISWNNLFLQKFMTKYLSQVLPTVLTPSGPDRERPRYWVRIL